MGKHKFAGNDPTIPLEVMAFVAAIEAGEVVHRKGKCMVPGCDSGNPGHDWDGAQFVYCSRHNAMMHLDYEVDIRSVKREPGWDGY